MSPNPHERPHQYSDRVHLLYDPMAAAGLLRLCDRDTPRAQVVSIVRSLYQEVLLRAAVNALVPAIDRIAITPMAALVGSLATVVDTVVNPSIPITLAVLLRAGDIPASSCHSRLLGLFRDVRLDYFGAARQTDAEHRVIGTAVTYQKSGPIDGRVLLLPDPMGATGGSMVQVLDNYGKTTTDTALAIAALHLIITPEYIRRMTKDYPGVHIFALRLDRGMSDTEVQKSVPGAHPDREFGLNNTQYIVPGAGDMGERLTGVA